ncbi:hypothetical protein [Streptomyces sp. NPDC006477]|uniref:hypothetical protein n=1 Tax=Streptomyces sp. NPDC006477 TaxID=3364747 RepID=UPI0036D1BE67
MEEVETALHPNVEKLFAEMGRLPADPVPEDRGRLKDMLIEQIIAFQDRYKFSGKQHTSADLQVKSFRYLERLCNLQLYGIASSKVSDKTKI